MSGTQINDLLSKDNQLNNDVNEDNFNTYAYHQIAKAIPLIKKAVEGIYNNNLKIKERKDLKPVVWTHPTLFEYIYFRFFNKIK